MSRWGCPAKGEKKGGKGGLDIGGTTSPGTSPTIESKGGCRMCNPRQAQKGKWESLSERVGQGGREKKMDLPSRGVVSLRFSLVGGRKTCVHRSGGTRKKRNVSLVEAEGKRVVGREPSEKAEGLTVPASLTAWSNNTLPTQEEGPDQNRGEEVRMNVYYVRTRNSYISFYSRG